jgi:tetratricopeptide (TPR) repeat protein
MLYLAIARKLDLPINGVYAPNHFFLRWDDGAVRRNIEVTLEGRAFPDEYYLSWKHITANNVANGLYLSNLSARQSLALLLHTRGLMLASLSRTSEALEDHGLAMRVGGAPLSVVGLNFIGNVYASQGLRDDALYRFASALTMNPDYYVTHVNRSVLYQSTGRFDLAIDDCSRAIEKNPRYAAAYHNRACYRYQSGDLRGALEDLEKALDVDPDYADRDTVETLIERVKGELGED